MATEDLNAQAAHCRNRASELRRAAARLAVSHFRATLLGLATGYDDRAEALEASLGRPAGLVARAVH